MQIKILGTGCAECNRLEQNVKNIIETHHLSDRSVEKVTDLNQMLDFGLLMTPGLIVNGEIVSLQNIWDTFS
jgi:small redox-active disulfide protein 2